MLPSFLLLLLLLFPFVGSTARGTHTEEVAERLTHFKDWFRANFYDHEIRMKVEPRLSSVARIGLFAAVPTIAQGEMYLRPSASRMIDKNVIFSHEAVGDMLRKWLATAVPQPHSFFANLEAVFAVYFIFENDVAGNTSFYAPYWKLMPEKLDVPLHFSEEQVLFLRQFTTIGDRVAALQRRVRMQFEALKTTLFALHPHVFPDNVFTLAKFQHAMSIVMTRWVWWDNEPHFAPMIDFANCRELPGRKRVHHTARVGQFTETRAQAEFRLGEEIFEDYGETNSFYFLFHGFVTTPNHHDCGAVKINFSQFAHLFTRETVDALRRTSFMRDVPCVSVRDPSSVSRLTQLLTAALLYTSAPPSERARLAMPDGSFGNLLQESRGGMGHVLLPQVRTEMANLLRQHLRRLDAGLIEGERSVQPHATMMYIRTQKDEIAAVLREVEGDGAFGEL
jgi:hypothetical protein